MRKPRYVSGELHSLMHICTSVHVRILVMHSTRGAFLSTTLFLIYNAIIGHEEQAEMHALPIGLACRYRPKRYARVRA